MEAKTTIIDLDDLEIFKELSHNPDSDSDDDFLEANFWKKPPLPREIKPPTKGEYIELETYIEENCGNRLTILQSSQSFSNLERPLVIFFNHFRELCYYHTKWLDSFHQLALKYEDHIDFMVGDLMDIDVLYPHRNPLEFFSAMAFPEQETPLTFAVDTKRRIYQHFDAYHSMETFSELCDNLLKQNLCLSQPLVVQKYEYNVKMCVHQTYKQLVTDSSKDVLLIVGTGDYEPFKENEPNFEKIAGLYQNLSLLYINCEQNYIPFEFDISYNTTIIFIPSKNKENFIKLNRPTTDASVIEFIEEMIGPQSEYFRQSRLASMKYKSFTLAEDEMDFCNFEVYLHQHFPYTIKILHKMPHNPKCALIFFMNFQKKGVSHYVETLRIIHQVAAAHYFCQYFIADISDINLLLPKWYRQERMQKIYNEATRPICIAIDRQNFKYLTDFSQYKTAASLFYYSLRVYYSRLFYSQLPTFNYSHLIKFVTAHNIFYVLQQSKRDIFLTIHQGENFEKSSNVLSVLEAIASEAKKLGIRLLKMDASRNTIPLEYFCQTYPANFFIPHKNKDEKTIRYPHSDYDKDNLLEFLRKINV
uniref:Thioredoxin domain-containing protein n=1 Tax=Stomoxys calcitrans TaxID=35570 RepID=A0A1I8QE90_STOCA